MASFSSQQGIGRGEIPESRVETPFAMAAMLVATLGVLAAYVYFRDPALTLALAVSALIFGVTILRADFGVYALVVAMMFSPEVHAGGVGHGERQLMLRYDDILIIVIFLGVVAKATFEGKPLLWLPSPVNRGLVAYYAVCLLSTLLALRLSVPAWDKKLAFFILLKMAEFYMIFVLVGNAVRGLRQVRNQLTVFLLVALVVCIGCIAQIGSVERLTAPFEKGSPEPNTLGGYLIIIMSLTAALFFHAPKLIQKAVFLGLFAAALLPFLFSLSRASFIAAIVALLTLGILLLPRGRGVFVIALVVGVLLFSHVLMPPEVMDRVNYTFQRGSGVPLFIGSWDTGIQVDKSTYERIYVWKKVLYDLRAWPWFGGGIAWGKVYDSQYARVIKETGLLGLAAFLFMQRRLLRTAKEARRWSRDWMARGLAMAMTASIVGLIVHSMGTITFLIIRIMEPFWFLMALTAVCRAAAIEEYRQRVMAQKQAAETQIAVPGTAAPATPQHAPHALGG